jgi:hypothetical protein
MISQIYNLVFTGVQISSVADPHHVDGDPDPAFFFDADPNPVPHHNDANL